MAPHAHSKKLWKCLLLISWGFLGWAGQAPSRSENSWREQGVWPAWGLMVLREQGRDEGSPTQAGACVVWTSCQGLRREQPGFLITLPRCGAEGKREWWGLEICPQSHRNGVRLFITVNECLFVSFCCVLVLGTQLSSGWLFFVLSIYFVLVSLLCLCYK